MADEGGDETSNQKTLNAGVFRALTFPSAEALLQSNAVTAACLTHVGLQSPAGE
ncbi:MAG: hypothetical protein ACTHLW_06260 [Verrucomicrobiota bacterium]